MREKLLSPYICFSSHYDIRECLVDEKFYFFRNFKLRNYDSHVLEYNW